MKLDYITEVSNKYGNKYDLSKLQFEGMDKPVTVICHKHGEFAVNAFDFLYRQRGCPSCRMSSGHGKGVSTKEILARAVKVWGDRWDYSRLKYAGHRGKVTIVCRQHGEFRQDIYNHLKGYVGCRECRYGLNKRFVNFLHKARGKYGDKYDYSKATYLDTKTPIEIICPQHGPFFTTPALHMRGVECPVCKPRSRKGYRRHKDISNKYITPQELELIREVMTEYVQERKNIQ